jgi:transcription initiation factor TFIID subunit 11
MQQASGEQGSVKKRAKRGSKKNAVPTGGVKGIVLKKKVGVSFVGRPVVNAVGGGGKRKIPILSRMQGGATLLRNLEKDKTRSGILSLGDDKEANSRIKGQGDNLPFDADMDEKPGRNLRDSNIEEYSNAFTGDSNSNPEATRQRILNMVASLHRDQQQYIGGVRSSGMVEKGRRHGYQGQEDNEEELEHPNIFGAMDNEPLISEEDALRNRIDEARQKAQEALYDMDNAGQKRYEAFRRSGLQRTMVKKWLQNYLGVSSINPNIVITCAGIAKVFVGELVEKACSIRDQWLVSQQEPSVQQAALSPAHIEEAFRQIYHSPGNISYAPSNRSHVINTRKRRWY